MNELYFRMKQVPSWIWIGLTLVALIGISVANLSGKSCLTCYEAPPVKTVKMAPVAVAVEQPQPRVYEEPAPEGQVKIDVPPVPQHHDQCEGGSRHIQIRSDEAYERMYISLRQPGQENPGWMYLGEDEASDTPALLVVCDNVSANFLVGFDGEFEGDTLEISLILSGQKIPLRYLACDEEPQACQQYTVVQEDEETTFFLVQGRR